MSEDTKTAQGSGDAIAEDERRTHQRLPASRLAGLSAQLATGPAVALKDVSRSGARFQSDSRLLPGLSVALRMVTPDGVVTVRGKVVRSRLVRMDKGGMGYEAAVAFSELLPDLGVPAAPAAREQPPVETSEPAVELATEITPDVASLRPESAAEAVLAAAAAARGIASPAASSPSPGPAVIADDASPAVRSDAAAAARAGDDDDEVPMMLLTASVSQTMAELHEIFNGNDW